MKLPFIQTLCAILISGAVSITYADEGKDESGKGRESGKYSYEKHWERGKDQRDGHWEDDAHGSYFLEHGYAHLDILRVTILPQANVAFGFLTAQQDINPLQETVIMFLRVRG